MQLLKRLSMQQVTRGDAALASSITLNVLKRTDTPILVTKPGTPAPMSLQGGLRAMLAVDQTARPLLKWMNANLVTASRGDKLILARVGGKDASSQVLLLLLLLLLVSYPSPTSVSIPCNRHTAQCLQRCPCHSKQRGEADPGYCWRQSCWLCYQECACVCNMLNTQLHLHSCACTYQQICHSGCIPCRGCGPLICTGVAHHCKTQNHVERRCPLSEWTHSFTVRSGEVGYHCIAGEPDK